VILVTGSACVEFASSSACSIRERPIRVWIESTRVKIALCTSDLTWVSCATAYEESRATLAIGNDREALYYLRPIAARPPRTSSRTGRRKCLSAGKVGRHGSRRQGCSAPVDSKRSKYDQLGTAAATKSKQEPLNYVTRNRGRKFNESQTETWTGALGPHIQ
jgi:hypothetical protein